MICCPCCLQVPERTPPGRMPYAECGCGRLTSTLERTIFRASAHWGPGSFSGLWMRVLKDGSMEARLGEAPIGEAPFPGAPDLSPVPEERREEVVRIVVGAALADSVLES